MLEKFAKNADEIIGASEIQKKLAAGKQLIIKHGVDPTTKQLHLGYLVNYRVMRRFQEEGHKVVLLLGDFTGRIGDPTDKIEARQGQKKEALREKAQNIIRLAKEVLIKDKLEIRYNSEWWDNMKLDDFMKIAKKISAARLWERDMFEKRIKAKKPVWVHEFLYPILQAQDSVELSSDLTVIGSDQKFNELMARDLQKENGQEPQALIIMPILPGTDGKDKMSQSLNNAISIDEDPKEIYGKIMSMPDSNILPYFKLLTDIDPQEIKKIETGMTAGSHNPRDAKMKLAREIITFLVSNEAAIEAEKAFKEVFQKNKVPEKMATFTIDKDIFILDILIQAGLVSSRTAGRRVIEQKGVKLNNKEINDPMLKISKENCPLILQKGKRHFIEIR
jgi:tyrosyl-tRNA synthetase